ncbi:MAG: lipoate--protein ligase family protein [Candidatus Latescibacterota bacterium]
MESWRLLDTGVGSGARNMAVDDALARLMAAGAGEPVLRLFAWDPPAISFGYGQDPARQVDLERCARAGVDLVRRPTGGRAVLHWEELTYSVICPDSHPRLGGPVEETYRSIGECLVAGLRRLGVNASLERVSGPSGTSHQQRVTAPCFSSTARWEIKCRGRKLIGSAQRRLDGVILQHGSLLLGPAHRRLPELLAGLSEDGRRQWVGTLQEHSVELGECLCGPPDVRRLSTCLVEGFEERLEARLHPECLTPAEEELAWQLQREVYGNPLGPRPRRPATVRCPAP